MLVAPKSVLFFSCEGMPCFVPKMNKTANFSKILCFLTVLELKLNPYMRAYARTPAY